MTGARKSKPCILCDAPVNRAGGPRAGLTAIHWRDVPVVGGVKRGRCDGSDMAYEAHGGAPEAAVSVLRPSPFRRTIARLRGHSVTWVDFLGARMARAGGNVDPMRFVLQEVRDA